LEYLSENELSLRTEEESLMAPTQSTCGRSCARVIAGFLVLGLAACGEKTEPPRPAKPVAPMIQPASPAPPAETKRDEARMAIPQQPPAPPANPDAELASRVRAALASDGRINAHRIDVTSESGVVTLYGTADNADQRARAGEIAAAVAGVRSVQNKLAIVAGS
jgi:hypothetical protein